MQVVEVGARPRQSGVEGAAVGRAGGWTGPLVTEPAAGAETPTGQDLPAPAPS